LWLIFLGTKYPSPLLTPSAQRCLACLSRHALAKTMQPFALQVGLSNFAFFHLNAFSDMITL